MRNNSSDNSDSSSNTGSVSSTVGGATSALVDSVDTMVKLPLQMTGATWDFMMQGVRNLTGMSGDSNDSGSGSSNNMSGTGSMGSSSGNSSGSSSSSSWTGSSNSSSNSGSNSGIISSLTGNNQDLSGDDLKYVVWSLIFTKPGHECLLEPQQSELVNYSADNSTFAALKIAKFLERARHGHVNRAEGWTERGYPPESSKQNERQTNIISSTDTDTTVVSTSSSAGSSTSGSSQGWRIPAEDQKFITFIYRVDWRLPKQEETVRVERVTIERGATTTSRN